MARNKSAGALALMLSQKAVAGVPASLVSTTVEAAALLAAGQTAAAGVAKVAALTEGVLKAMFLHKIKNIMVVVLVISAVGMCASGLLRA